ncbi:hypothetical protein QE429_001508 [Bacillus sp. SORGH_AS 510]|uniref:hypothetical protein n=1 Tax=Bacillus sp. SORGH_AS_0510 TaxID=3041771 RepID=UPI00278AAD5E|nr:hypothetical protein [Bacillus sp. SORGH_AS_0510]MDQ1144681.1 hypothetical protein [Bacillus sp. SORGH_AS_0510]
MDKKQKISWGVSFGSLALVAGMVSYLGLSNGNKDDSQIAVNQGPSIDNSNQQSEDPSNTQTQRPEQGFRHSFGRDRSSQFNQNDQDTNSFDDSNQYPTDDDQFFDNSNQQDQFSNNDSPVMGRHGGFDTTTGGT